MIKALVTYYNTNNKLTTKGFANVQDAYEFVKKLDERIAKGTCGGYDLVTL